MSTRSFPSGNGGGNGNVDNGQRDSSSSLSEVPSKNLTGIGL